MLLSLYVLHCGGNTLITLPLSVGFLTDHAFGELRVSMRRDTVVRSVLSALTTMLDQHAAPDNNALVQLNRARRIIDAVIELNGEDVLASL